MFYVHSTEYDVEIMRVVLIGPYPENVNCIKGGTESSVFGLAIELSKKHEIIVIDYPRLNGSDKCEHVEYCGNKLSIYRYKIYGKHYEDAVNRINDIHRLLLDIKPEIVHIHGTNVFDYKIYTLCKSIGLKVILTVHGLAQVEKWNALKAKFSLKAIYQFVKQTYYERRLLNKADNIIVDTEYVAIAIRKSRLNRLPNIHVIPQGINDQYFTLQNIYNGNGVETPSCNNAKMILSVGTISRRKGRLQLLKAFDKVCEVIPNVELVIAGGNKEIPMYQQVMNYISKSPNRDKIHIYPDISQQDLYKLYETAYIFTLHTEEESQGIVFAEAMATGLPVVATNVGGVPYVVKDSPMYKESERTGLLSNFGDINTMVKNVCELLNNEQLYKQLSYNARAEANKYSWLTISNEIVKLYKIC